MRERRAFISLPLEPCQETKDDEEHEEVFTLGRMNTRSQTRVSWYFASEEIEHDKDTVQIKEEAIGIDDDDFNQALHGDLDAADEDIK
jgi:hypothetical protein